MALSIVYIAWLGLSLQVKYCSFVKLNTMAEASNFGPRNHLLLVKPPIQGPSLTEIRVIEGPSYLQK